MFIDKKRLLVFQKQHVKKDGNICIDTTDNSKMPLNWKQQHNTDYFD